MNDICDVQSHISKKFHGDYFRKKKHNAGNCYQWNNNMHNENIAELLQWIEFMLFGNWKWRMFSFENTKRIISGLEYQIFNDSFSENIMFSVGCDHIAN